MSIRGSFSVSLIIVLPLEAASLLHRVESILLNYRRGHKRSKVTMDVRFYLLIEVAGLGVRGDRTSHLLIDPEQI